MTTTWFRRRRLLPSFLYFASHSSSFSPPLHFHQHCPLVSIACSTATTLQHRYCSSLSPSDRQSFGIVRSRHQRFSSYSSRRGTMSDETFLPKIENSEVVGKTKWLELRTLTYTDQEGKERKWDYATRTTKQSPDKPDAVIIIPLLKKSGGDQTNQDDDVVLDTILVEQFRPPVRQVTLEFPAGLIDKDETPEQTALRELKEETGYVGSTATVMPSTVSRVVCMSPGLADETVQVVLVHVDLDHPDNINPQAQPDAGEHIIVRRVSLKEGFQSMLDEASSAMAIQGLYLFAMGLEIGKTIGKS